MTGFEPVGDISRPSPTSRLLPTFLVLVVIVVIAIVTARPGSGLQPGETASLPASPVDGVVIAVDSAGLGHVGGFTVRLAGGWSYVFKLGILENATEFSPSHLAEHMASSSPIRVFYRLENSVPTVYRLEDAPSS